MNVKNINEWRNKISTTHRNFENSDHKTRETDSRNHCMKHSQNDNNKWEKITIIRNMRKLTEKNAQTNNAKIITQKNKKHDDYHKNLNIMLRKKDIIDTLNFKIQKKQRCVFSHNAWTSR